MHRRFLLPALLAAAAASGCTYVQERRDLNAGGPAQREAAAQAALDAERQRSSTLTAQQAARERELEDINKRLTQAQTSLDEQSKRLDAALKGKQISAARAAELKKQIDALKSDTSSLKLRNDADRAVKASNTASDPAKLKQIATLDQRRKELEAALQAAVKQ